VTAASAQRVPLQAGGDVAVLLCSDVIERRRGALSAEMLGAGLRSHVPGLTVTVVRDLCAWSSGLTAAVQSLAATRVVVGCSNGAQSRQRVLAALRSAGVRPPAAHVVNLSPVAGRKATARVTDQAVADQAVAVLRSALARVAGADLGAPLNEGTASLGSASVTRRSLLSFGYLARRPVAAWDAERCRGHGASRRCVHACPHEALAAVANRVCVDTAACSACGACVSACASGAMSLNGTSIADLEAAAGALVDDASRLGLGVAVMCTKASVEVPLGGTWLPLEVPSLEMVSAGWLLQMVTAGVPVTLVACADTLCVGHGREVARVCAALVEGVAPGRRLLLGAGDRSPGDLLLAGDLLLEGDLLLTGARDRSSASSVTLGEPRATAQALSLLASLGGVVVAPSELSPPGPAGTGPAAGTGQPAGTEQAGPAGLSWSLESPLVPLGEVAIDPSLCSGCANCTLVCPTGALLAARDEVLSLTFDLLACPACGNCAASCPEGAISLRRAISSASLAAGRRTVARIVTGRRCKSCGQPLGGDPLTRAVAARLAESHPQVAVNLQGGDRCAECELTSRSPDRPARLA
jgi:ferredoxin